MKINDIRTELARIDPGLTVERDGNCWIISIGDFYLDTYDFWALTVRETTPELVRQTAMMLLAEKAVAS